jgi:hypothetical protein
MTEEQKMEEGKRMFHIFAARLFEQRVLHAYRERVAQERQLQLLRELEDEDKLTKEREAKKQSQNQKKKDKKRFAIARLHSLDQYLMQCAPKHRMQKQAKEEEKAKLAAGKAAEELARKEEQIAIEEAQRKKRDEERRRREAARKAQEEEKQRKEEERRKRLAEEKEREVERERKRKEREERAKSERREKEERERKAREEREAKIATEKAAAAAKREQEKEEREKRLSKEREIKAEKEARERLALAQQQQRAATAAKPRAPPVSPARNSTPSSGSSPRAPSANGTPKKILNKPAPVSTLPAPVQPPRQQQQRPAALTTVSQPQTPMIAQMPAPLPPPQSSQVFAQGPGLPPPLPAISPRPPFSPTYGFPSVQQQQGPPPSNLAPSPLPRSFGPPQFEQPSFAVNSRGGLIVPAAPIGPPSRAAVVQNTTIISPPANIIPVGASSRRASIPDPGPVARPLAPIARPSIDSSQQQQQPQASGSGSASPRRSPSPKGVLGSSALIADEDEVIAQPGRRVVPGAVGQGWGPASPLTAVETARTPWGPPGIVPARPTSVGNVWGSSAPLSADWNNFYSSAAPFGHANPPPPTHLGS